MRAAHIPGLALGVVRGDQVVYLKGYGIAGPDGRSVRPQTPLILGSTSKSFTALAVMKLVEAGKIDLDAPVTKYLPWFRFGGFAIAYVSAKVYVPGDAATTAGNVLANAGLVRIGVIADLLQATIFVFPAMVL
jgi:CubicO group peptidase (beta-lactamase class C family)